MKSRKNCVKKNVSGKTIDECVDVVLKKTLGMKLGQGEQGTVYAIGEYVIKVTSLAKKGMENIWFEEVCKAQDLGELKIAPTIRRHFICNKHGFIVMDRLTPMKSMTVSNKKDAVIQMKKHCPLNQIEMTLFYRVATGIINKSYKWGDAKSGKSIPLSLLPAVIDKGQKEPIDFLKFITDPKKIKHLNYPDVFVGSLCYAKIITQEKDDRDDTYLDFIYLVRNPNNLKDADKAVIQIFQKL